MSSEEQRLAELREKMSSKQRQEMAEIIQNELKRREQLKTTGGAEASMTMPSNSKVKANGLSSGLNGDQVKELYGEVKDTVNALRQKKIDGRLENLRAEKGLPVMTRDELRQKEARRGGSSKAVLFVAAIAVLGAAKIMFATGAVDASVAAKPHSVAAHMTTDTQEPRAALRTDATFSAVSRKPSWSGPEKEVLLKLDARRVELEKRKALLDRREAELQSQMDALNERLAELRSLTARLGEKRKEKDLRYEARLEQLANVYGSMAPDEAAPLIEKLDPGIALALLKRLPGKRMGQVLSSMSKRSAIDLTRMLAESQSE